MGDTLLITGAGGFVGSALMAANYPGFKPLGLYRTGGEEDCHGDITDPDRVEALCQRHRPRCVVHCAGLAHQSFHKAGEDAYFNVNTRATETLARAAVRANPNVHFIFLSSVSVYGERMGDSPLNEADPCFPSGAYAKSKLAAEKALGELFETGVLKHLDMLRLAPMYDGNWHLNLDRRVLGPGKGFFIRFGTGNQRISALSRPNLVGFVQYLLSRGPGKALGIFNLCDPFPYTFRDLIKALSRVYPRRPVVPCPLGIVWGLSRVGGLLFPHNREWWHGCHSKLAADMVYDVSRMEGTGFCPLHDLEGIFTQTGIG